MTASKLASRSSLRCRWWWRCCHRKSRTNCTPGQRRLSPPWRKMLASNGACNLCSSSASLMWPMAHSRSSSCRKPAREYRITRCWPRDAWRIARFWKASDREYLPLRRHFAGRPFDRLLKVWNPGTPAKSGILPKEVPRRWDSGSMFGIPSKLRFLRRPETPWPYCSR